VLSVCFSFIMNLTIDENKASKEADASGFGIEYFFYRTALDNKAFDSILVSWFHVFMVFVYTFLTINAV
jgi:hypothetical protein